MRALFVVIPYPLKLWDEYGKASGWVECKCTIILSGQDLLQLLAHDR